MSKEKKTKTKKEEYSIIKDRHLYPGKMVDLNSSEEDVLKRYALVVSKEEYHNVPGVKLHIETANESGKILYLRSLLMKYFFMDLSQTSKKKLPFVVRRDVVRENIEKLVERVEIAKDFLSNL